MTSSSSPRKIETLATGFCFLEAPRWRDGVLYVSDFYRHRVCTVDLSGKIDQLCDVPGQPSGLGFTPTGQLLVVSMTDRSLRRLDNGALKIVADLSQHAPYHCNDMVVDAQGRAYVGNFGWNIYSSENIVPTVLLMVQPDGTVSVAAEDLYFPNGSVLTSDGKKLLVAETYANRISAFDVSSEGALKNRRIWASFSDKRFSTISEAIEDGAVLPDGICMDAEGALWVSDAAGNGTLRVAEGGRVLDFVDTGNLAVYATAMGGVDGRTLFMCAAKPLPSDFPGTYDSVVLTCRVDVPSATHR